MSTESDTRDTLPDAAATLAAGVLALHGVTDAALATDVAEALRVAAETERELLARYVDRLRTRALVSCAPPMPPSELAELLRLIALDVREGAAR